MSTYYSKLTYEGTSGPFSGGSLCNSNSNYCFQLNSNTAIKYTEANYNFFIKGEANGTAFNYEGGTTNPI